MHQKEQYLEKNSHGTAVFPAEYYDCVYPTGLTSLPVHWHEEFEITVVKKGSCTYLIDLEPYPVKEGDFLFLAPGTLHGIPEADMHFPETESFVFHPRLLGNADDICTMKYVLPVQKGQTRFAPIVPEAAAGPLRELFARLKTSYQSRETGYELRVKALLLEIFCVLYQKVPHEAAARDEVIDKLKVVLQYMKDHYQEPVLVSELAGLCHFSEYYFMRFFKQHMNMTCIAYLNQYRLEIAAGRLAQEQSSVTEIALDSGFHNLSYFNRAFKSHFHMTPKEYRERGKG